MSHDASRKLKIAVWHNLPSGGGKRALWQHVVGLQRRGHYLESWCPVSAATGYLPFSQICREHALPLVTPKRIRFLNSAADFLLIKARIEAMRAHSRACAEQIHAGGFDVLLANSCASFAMPAVGRYVEMPKAVYLQEPYRRFYEALPESFWAAPLPEKFQSVTSLRRLTATTLRLQAARVQMREEIENAKHFDRVLVNSFFSRESLLRAYGVESEVCYLGIDTDLFHPTHEPVENYVISLGAVHFHKGADRAIRGLAVIPPARRPKLVWVGNDAGTSYVAEMKALAKQLGVEFEVKVMVTDAELVSLLSRATALLYASRLEPFGLAPLEANACGTPVIAIAEGGVRESIAPGENGWLVADARPETIAAAVQKLMAQPALAVELRARCRNTVVARWGMDAAAERLEKALLATVNGHRPATA